MGASGVGTEQQGGRAVRRTGGRWRHAESVCGPLVRPSGRPTSEDNIPTATVTPVPSGTYHGHARPGNRRHGTPSTIGVMTRTLTTIAAMTSRSRARDHTPPRRHVPTRPPYVIDAIVHARRTTRWACFWNALRPASSTAVHGRGSQRPA